MYFPASDLSSRGIRFMSGSLIFFFFNQDTSQLPFKLGSRYLIFVKIIFTDSAVAQGDNAVCHVLYSVVMRYHYDGIAVLFVYVLDKFEYLLRGVIIECAGRLVAKENIGVFNYRSADSSSLLLTAAELVRQLMAMLIKTERLLLRSL